MQKIAFFTIILFGLSCNRAILVPKENIIHYQKGYLLFYYNNTEALFFPSLDTINQKFLSNNHFNGYKIGSGERDIQYLLDLADKEVVVQDVQRNNQTISVENQIALIPVIVQYYWGGNYKASKNSSGEQIIVRYQYKSKNRELLYRLYDQRIIMSIVPLKR